MIDDVVVRAPIGAYLPYRGTRVIERTGWYQLITPGTTGANEVLFSPGDADVATVMAEYAAARVPRFRWCVWPWAEALEAPLLAHGFERWEARAMVAERHALAIAAPRDVLVEEVVAIGARFDAYLDTLVTGWEQSPEERAELAACLARVLAEPARRHRFYLASCEGVPVGTGGFVIQPEAIYLTGGNVLPAFRGRGIYRALIAARLADAGGARYITTHARAHTSAPILERLGFRTAASYRVFLSP